MADAAPTFTGRCLRNGPRGPDASESFILETSRLQLRELAASDVSWVEEMFAHPDVARYYERRFDRRDAEVFVERQIERYRRDGHGLWLALERETGRPVGTLGLAMQDVEGDREPEIGYLLHRGSWGRGYATETAAGIRDAAFDRWSYPRVISLIRPINQPSRRVAERIGMRIERTVRHAGMEHLLYSITQQRE